MLAELDKVFNFKKFLIYVFPQFNCNLTCASCYLQLLKENLTQNVYSGKVFIANNEFIVTNV